MLRSIKFRKGITILCFLFTLINFKAYQGYAESLEYDPGSGDTEGLLSQNYSDIENVIQTGLSRNEALKRYFYNWRSAVSKITYVNQLPDPKFGYGYYIQEVETRTGPQKQRFSLSQTFPWFGKLKDRKDKQAQIAKSQFYILEAQKNELIHEIKSQFFEFDYIEKALEITFETKELLKRMEKVVQVQVQAGEDLSNLLKTQTEIGLLEERLGSLLDRKNAVVAQLNAYLNFPSTFSLPAPKVTTLNTENETDFEAYRSGIEQNPKILSLECLIKSHGSQIKISKKDFYPDITFGLDLIETENSSLISASDNGRNPIIASVSFSIPLWQKKYQSSLAAAKHDRLAAIRSLNNFQNHLSAALEIAITKFREADRKAKLYQSSLIPLAENALSVTEQSYKNGKSNFLDFMDSQKMLLELRLIYQRAESDRFIYKSQMDSLIGKF